MMVRTPTQHCPGCDADIRIFDDGVIIESDHRSTIRLVVSGVAANGQTRLGYYTSKCVNWFASPTNWETNLDPQLNPYLIRSTIRPLPDLDKHKIDMRKKVSLVRRPARIRRRHLYIVPDSVAA